MNAAFSPLSSSASARQVGRASRRGASPALVLEPAGFTLVELLVVIGIIAALAALVTPAVFQARRSAQNAAIKAEIDMLHMAIMNYKNEYGSFPPAFDADPDIALQGSGQFANAAYAQKHLGRLFPRCAPSAIAGPAGQFQGTTALHPANAIRAWLLGFTDDPTSPLLPLAGRKKLYDFDTARLDTTQLIYFPTQNRNAPYIYIPKSDYPKFDIIAGTISQGWPTVDITYSVGSTSPVTYTISSSTAPQQRYYPHRMPANVNPSTPYFNEDSFQILCAGMDGIFGTDDDLSNFWKGTRKDYLDSLQ